MTQGPIFLLGSGRCGSTAVQRELSNMDGIWIWGEHDGILRGLLSWGETVKQSEVLHKLSFNNSTRSPEQIMHEAGEGEANSLAWLNSFRPSDVDVSLRDLILRLFATKLPAGTTCWGFKEIRYGPEDRVAEHLLRLFPKAKIVHVVRDPISTIYSSLAAWNSTELNNLGANPDQLREKFKEYADRWMQITQYYLDLKKSNPSRVFTLRIENFSAQKAPLMAFLEIEPSTMPSTNLVRINSAPRSGWSISLESFRLTEDYARSELTQISKECGY